MWVRSENGDGIRPPEVDDTSSKQYVYVRRNLALVEGTDEVPEHWEWDELRVPRDSWESWEQSDMNAEAMADLSGLASDIAETLDGYGDAIAELSAMLSEIMPEGE